MRKTALISSLVALQLTLIASVGSEAAPPNALPATVRNFPAAVSEASYPAQDASGAQLPAEPWRVVGGTGNCCENYLASTHAGRLLDFGGGELRFSDDQGASWKEVASLGTLGGEGAVVEAPGGDIVGITWDPYTGDRLEAYKFVAAEGKWYYAEQALHQPFFDRPYLTVVRGPFTVGGMTVPYITIMLGGWPQKTTYVSTDGINYVPTTSPQDATGTSKSRFFEPSVDPETDWLQPLTVPFIAPRPGGGAVSWLPGSNGSVALRVLDAPEMSWSPFSFPDGQTLRGRLLFDSAGRIHNVVLAERSFEYRISSDGGRSWSSTQVSLPEGYKAALPSFDRFWDFKTNQALEMGVVSLYARNVSSNKDQNLVFIISTSSGVPRADKVLFLGQGDKAFGTGLGAGDRLDFVTIAILPDGKVATTFLDGKDTAPAVAITLDSQKPSASDGTPPPSPSSPSPSPQVEPSPSAQPSPSATPGPSPSPSPSEQPSDDTIAPLITGVSDRPDPFTPDGDGHKDATRIRYTISEDSSVSIVIFTWKGKLVKTLADDLWQSSGEHKIKWDGRMNSGKRARPHKYFYEIVAVDAAGNQSDFRRRMITVKR